MKFKELKLKGAFLIVPEKSKDARGYFARTFCQKEFGQKGLTANFVQTSVSLNKKKGTLRGMHYQAKPHEEVKLVQCIQGSIFDVIIDLRPESSTYGQWESVELNDQESNVLYIPKSLAHGFQTLADNTIVQYHISEFYHPGSAQGFRWDDPKFNIHWPLPVSIISDQDTRYPKFPK